MESINFKGNQYRIREIQLPEFGDVIISTVKLNSDLFDINENYVSIEARQIDEQIFFFVEENEITLPKKSLKKLLNNQIK